MTFISAVKASRKFEMNQTNDEDWWHLAFSYQIDIFLES